MKSGKRNGGKISSVHVTVFSFTGMDPVSSGVCAFSP
jgi:hypothetical protein